MGQSRSPICAIYLHAEGFLMRMVPWPEGVGAVGILVTGVLLLPLGVGNVPRFAAITGHFRRFRASRQR